MYGIFESAASCGPRGPWTTFSNETDKVRTGCCGVPWNIKCFSTGHLECRDDGQPVFDVF